MSYVRAFCIWLGFNYQQKVNVLNEVEDMVFSCILLKEQCQRTLSWHWFFKNIGIQFLKACIEMRIITKIKDQH